jgi:DNA-binding FadR family transcriptional regulator
MDGVALVSMSRKTGPGAMILSQIDSDLLRYILAKGCVPGARLPSLGDISQEIGMSVGKLREQLEVARALGLIEASPRRGISCQAYSFLPAVRLSLMVALSLDRQAFAAFSSLRVHLEIAFWDEAVALLTAEDKIYLSDLIQQAKAKLNHERIQIPHAEHRALHLTIYGRLHNPFVTGLLEAYWDAYEAFDLNTYADYNYLQAVWHYHDEIVKALCEGRHEEGKDLLIAHMRLLDKRGISLEAPIPMAAGSAMADMGNGQCDDLPDG